MFRDVRYALRSLARAPGFTVTVLATLALGIGGATTMFSVVDAILLKPLPYREPRALVSLTVGRLDGTDDGSFTAADFLDYARDNRTFSALAGFRQDIVDLSGRSEPVRLSAVETSPAFFDVMGVEALVGRVYRAGTDRPEGSRIAVVSEGMWRRHLGADANVAGSTLRLNGVPYTVVGVAPAHLIHPVAADLWTLAAHAVPSSPIPLDGSPLEDRSVGYVRVMGRLATGVSLARANDDLRGISERLARDFPGTNGNERATAAVFHDVLVGDVRQGLWLLLAAVGCVLLIACANVASLLLARGRARQREMAVRGALGASRGRLVGQLLTESLVLASLGGGLGLLAATWGVETLVSWAPSSIPRLDEVRIDPRAALFSLVVAATAGVLFGLTPARHGTRVDMVEAFKSGGRTHTGRAGARGALVAAEVALALALLVCAGLLLTSFARLRGVDVGFDSTRLTVTFVPLPLARYDAEAQVAFYTRLAQSLQQNPVVGSSALAFPTPFSGANASGDYLVEGGGPAAPPALADLTVVTPGFFKAMGLAILRGRDLTTTDTDKVPVAVVNQTFAMREWPNQDPLGRRFTFSDSVADAEWITVVGVVADSRTRRLEAPVQPSVYLSHAAFPVPYMGAVVRSDASAGVVGANIRAAVKQLDPELPVDSSDTVIGIVGVAAAEPRFRALVIATFAAIALMLAGVGIFGLVNYTVGQRKNEIGVRLALGATPRTILALVMQQGLGLVSVGIALGLVGAWMVSSLLQGLLFSVSAREPAVYLVLALLLLTVGAIACYLPARRAMRIDPMLSLKAE